MTDRHAMTDKPKCDTFDEYDALADETVFYESSLSSENEKILYCAIGVGEEAGEVLGKIKKTLRDHGGNFDDAARKQAILLEIGDVLFYSSQLARQLGSSLHDVANANLEKIYARRSRGTLRGEGDDR